MLAGVKVAVLLGTSYVTVPDTGVAPAVTVKLAVMIVALFIVSLKVAVIAPLMATPVAELLGVVEFTVGIVEAGGVTGSGHPTKAKAPRSATRNK